MKKEEKAVVDAERIREAERILKEYKRGKASLEARIVDNELWYRMRHASPHAKNEPANASGWLFNALASKHADAMDNYPEPVFLPMRRVVFRAGQMLVDRVRTVDQFGKLRDGLSKKQRAVMRNVDLPQCLRQQRVRLAAARRSAV